MSSVAAVSDSLKCSLCLDVFEDPVFCGGRPCQCTFCRGCIERVLVQGNRCPTCRAEIRKRDLLPQRVIRSLIDELVVECERKCGWTGRRDAHALHLSKCPIVQLESTQEQLEAAKREILSLRRRNHDQAVQLADKDAQLDGLMRLVARSAAQRSSSSGQNSPTRSPLAACTALAEDVVPTCRGEDDLVEPGPGVTPGEDGLEKAWEILRRTLIETSAAGRLSAAAWDRPTRTEEPLVLDDLANEALAEVFEEWSRPPSRSPQDAEVEEVPETVEEVAAEAADAVLPPLELSPQDVAEASNDLPEAVESGRLEEVLRLLSRKACPCSRDPQGWSVLDTAALSGYPEVTVALLNARANVNAFDDASGTTALMWAAIAGQTSCVQVLLHAQADANATAADGDTALQLAAQRGYNSICALISQHSLAT